VTAPPAVRVRVPATSANLGPGFDCLGLALDWYDEVRVEVGGRGVQVVPAGDGGPGEPAAVPDGVRREPAGVPDGEAHLVVRALRRAVAAVGGEQPRGLRLACGYAIPHGRGLGSSAAAIVAGLVAGRALSPEGERRLPNPALLRLAAAMEGHPDNVAAALLGGLTVAWTAADGAHALRLEPAQLHPVVLVPTTRSPTPDARRLLPASVGHAAAAANAGRAALLVAALTTRPDLLLPATEDFLHQQYRQPVYPRSFALVTRLRSAGVPAVVSGSGPSVLAFPAPGAPLPEVETFQAVAVGVDRYGAQVTRE